MTNGWPERVIPAQAGIYYSLRMRRDFQPAVYILASKPNGTLYTGVTSNLMQRIAQHREGAFDGFAKKYDIKRLAWFEPHDSMESAIRREKQLKKWNRSWKVRLIEEDNPHWRDLAEDYGFERLS